MSSTFWQAGHKPTLISAFLYFDLSFMVWVLLGPLAVQIAADLHLTHAQKGMMVATPILSGALLRLVMGVLVDHLVPGSKEWHITERVRGPFVAIAGTPYVDVWQSVRPERLGFDRWPVIPHGQSWKHGIVAELGWPHETQIDIAHAWKRILATVRTYADLEPTLLASVEELIDFVTQA